MRPFQYFSTTMFSGSITDTLYDFSHLRHYPISCRQLLARMTTAPLDWAQLSLVMSRQLSLIFDKSHVEFTAEEKRENSTESWFGAYPVSFLINSVPRVLAAVVRRQHLLPVHACKGVVPAFYLSSVSGSGRQLIFSDGSELPGRWVRQIPPPSKMATGNIIFAGQIRLLSPKVRRPNPRLLSTIISYVALLWHEA